MRKNMESIRGRFYEYDANAHDAGFAPVHVPIFDPSAELQAALTVVMSGRGEPARMQSGDIQHLKPVRETALEISRTLGSIEMANEMASTM